MLLPLDQMKSVDYSSLSTRVLFTLVQDVTMDQNQTSSLDFSQHVFLVVPVRRRRRRRRVYCVLEISGPLLLFFGYRHKRGPRAVLVSHKPFIYRRSAMATGSKTQASVLCRGILQGDPEPNGRRAVRVQERAVLVWVDGAPNLGLFAYHHALEQSRIFIPQVPRNGRVAPTDAARV